jgi:5-oxoprolinase (ATP-hydrolysing)
MRFLEAGVSRIEKVADLLRGGPYPSRRPEENLADLEAQAASVNHGLRAIEALALEDGGDFVRERMESILERSSRLMLNLLREHEGFSESRRSTLDDGTPIEVRITVSNGRMVLDFTGSGAVHPRNLNATPAILRSVVLFVIRLWLDADVPLNEGLLEPVEIVLPTGFLNPDFPMDPTKCPAVVGGNVETSQRVADVLLSVLGLSANGPGTMNNFLFGNGRFGYYETISGGSGAGPHHSGCSGRHVHMTNTAITDPEVLEHRFPVRLHRYELRRGSGGNGLHSGGDGVIREVGFLEPLTVSFLTERRSTRPEGLEGGESGAAGSLTRAHADGRKEILPAAVTYQAAAGESVIIETPGGAGWGPEPSTC